MTEAEIRNALLSALAKSPEGVGAAFFSEMFVDGFARRADLVMANGKLAAFEIKSERDSLDRLEGQLESYSRFFEQVTVVCAQRHLVRVRALAASDVGLWVVDAAGGLSVVRRARSREIRDKIAWLSFLPVDEMRALLRQKGLATAGTRDELLTAAVKGLKRSVLRDYVLSFMKRRHLRIQELKNRRRHRSVDASPVTAAAQRRLDDFVKGVDGLPTLPALPRLVQSKSSTSSP